jgi:hypothetical protein
VTVFKKGSPNTIAFRGSEGAADVANSIGIGNGTYNDQVRDAIEFVGAFLAQVTTNVVLTGHSLGGALAGIAGSYFGLGGLLVRTGTVRHGCDKRSCRHD